MIVSPPYDLLHLEVIKALLESAKQTQTQITTTNEYSVNETETHKND